MMFVCVGAPLRLFFVGSMACHVRPHHYSTAFPFRNSIRIFFVCLISLLHCPFMSKFCVLFPNLEAHPVTVVFIFVCLCFFGGGCLFVIA